MSKALYLGIDLGTSGVRCTVVDEAGHERGHAQIRYPSPAGPIVDAEDWWRATEACLDQQVQAMHAAGLSPKDIRALAIDGTSGSMVLVDEAIRPVTQGLMYSSAGFDAEAEVIARHAEAGSITRGSNSALARMLRLQSHDSENHARHLCHQADFIAARIMGRAGHSDDNNAL
ncbi:MAG: carbohydrate kinase, partial [Methylobacterium sp.]|nr:carbohydrate kinase [Methylobacterium sp.]